jgi:hypothetical protein
MKFNTQNRQLLSGAIIFFYLIPFLFFASYSIGLMSRNKSWFVLSLGLLLIAACSLILILLLSYWENNLKKHLQQDPKAHPYVDSEQKVTSLDLSYDMEQPLSEYESKNNSKELSLLEALNECHQQNSKLQEEIENLHRTANAFAEENKDLRMLSEEAIQGLEDYKLFSEEQLKQKQLQINNLQQLIDDQRSEMEKRQDQIQLLDTKIYDLSYEIKTLLHLNQSEPDVSSTLSTSSEPVRQILHELNAEMEASSPFAVLTEFSEAETKSDQPIKTAGEAVALLKKCIHNAQKLTGANFNTPEALRYREFSSSNYNIDQRRLFDSLRSEMGGMIIVYSPKDNKVLFSNQMTKTLLGWSPEKFTSDFSIIIQEGMTYWKKALSLLASTPESQARLLAKTKQGQETLLNCHLGVIPAGLFRGYVIGVLYPA